MHKIPLPLLYIACLTWSKDICVGKKVGEHIIVSGYMIFNGVSIVVLRYQCNTVHDSFFHLPSVGNPPTNNLRLSNSVGGVR
jgi:hypothetical protein